MVKLEEGCGGEVVEVKMLMGLSGGSCGSYKDRCGVGGCWWVVIVVGILVFVDGVVMFLVVAGDWL